MRATRGRADKASRRARRVLLLLAVACSAAVGVYFAADGDWGLGDPEPLSYAELTGSFFPPAPAQPFRTPAVAELRLPPLPNASSVWGATGRDARGRIWVGVSTRSSAWGARLLQFDPPSDTWHDRGSVLDRLRSAGVYRDGEGQTKIHSRIVPAADGWLYFASTDEDGEVPGTTLPRWGAHLWRVHPDTQRWEHLAAMPEGIVAMSGGGRFVFALGYWDHVLYRFDTASKELRRTVVGSTGGHVSRNLLSDLRGHAYVPRVRADAKGALTATLVEYDGELKLLEATPLDFYLAPGAPDANLGIVGVAYLADGRLAFTTHRGQLYAIDPRGGGAAKVSALGWFHPQGERYAPGLFALGGNLLAGLAKSGNDYEWVMFDLRSRASAAFPLDTRGLDKVLLYGSITRDNDGRFYLGGWASDGGQGTRPLVIRVDAPGIDAGNSMKARSP